MKGWLMRLIVSRRFVLSLLLLAILSTVAFGLTKTIRNIDLTLMVFLAIIGLGFCWLASSYPLKNWLFTLISCFLGIFGATIYSANLMKPIGALLKAIWGMLVSKFHWSSQGSQAISILNETLQQIYIQLWAFFSRFAQWVGQLITGQVGRDATITSMLIILVFWIAVMWAGWLVFHYHSALFAILPAAVMLTGALNYVAGNPFYLVPLVGTTLILIAITNYDNHERYWLSHKIDYAEDILFDLKMLVPVLGIGFMLVAAFAPSFSIQQVINASQRLTQKYQAGFDNIAKSFGLEPGVRSSNSFGSLINPGLPRSLLLGSGPELSKDIVMVIQTGDFPPVPANVSISQAIPRYYWRSTTYDVYSGHGWVTSPIEVVKYSANEPAFEENLPLTDTLHIVHQKVQFTQDVGSVIYSAGQLIIVDEKYQVAWRRPPADQPSDNQEQVADEFGATFTGASYSADSFINRASLSQLRTASGEIPAWIKNRYLAIPDELPNRVRTLAVDLTKDQHSAYDQAAAIETYLRTITYTLDLPMPPADRDVVDYFLFDLKRGYCDYYASAMVVMARAIGLPSRLVTGYSTGTYDPSHAYYLVSQADAHSWAEVYIAGIGWVEFEPTASYPVIPHPEAQAGNIEMPVLNRAQTNNFSRLLSTIRPHLLMVIGGMMGAFLSGMMLWLSSDRWRLLRLTPSDTIIRLYRRFYRRSKAVARQCLPGDTPFEYAERIKQSMQIIKIPKWSLRYFKRTMEDSRRLTALYNQAVYSPHIPGKDDQKISIELWSKLRIRLWLAGKLGNFQRSGFKIKSVH